MLQLCAHMVLLVLQAMLETPGQPNTDFVLFALRGACHRTCMHTQTSDKKSLADALMAGSPYARPKRQAPSLTAKVQTHAAPVAWKAL